MMKWLTKNIQITLVTLTLLLVAIGISGLFLFVRNNSRRLVEFRTGHVYYGNLKKGKADGYGELINPTGEIYTGWFEDGLFNGSGASVFPVGDTYCGEFEDGMMSGRGVYTFTSGENYKGGFKGNLFYGFGVVRKECGVMRYCGNWIDGYINGVLFNERISYESHGEIRRHVEKKIHMNNRDLPDQIIMHHNHLMQVAETFNCHAQTLFTLYDSSGKVKNGVGVYIDRYGTAMFISNPDVDVLASDIIKQYRSNKIQFTDRLVEEVIISNKRKISIIKSFDRQNVPFFHLMGVSPPLKFCQPCLVIGLLNDSLVPETAVVSYSDSKKLVVELPNGFKPGFTPFLVLNKQAFLAAIAEKKIYGNKIESSVMRVIEEEWIEGDSLLVTPSNEWKLFPDLIEIAKNTIESITDTIHKMDSLEINRLYVENDEFNAGREVLTRDTIFTQEFYKVLNQKEVYDSVKIYRILYPQQTIMDIQYGAKDRKYSVVFDGDSKVISLREYKTAFRNYRYETF